MTYGIYSRKSKFTGKGESIENQIELCKEYITHKYYEDKDIHIEVYEDEGFSGKNTARPEFQRMLSDVKKKKLNFIICYRLDRISRSVGDFAKTIEDLERQKIGFVCIKEQFDTSTPMGKAMMNIAAVFAQLERETIAERIRDNMLFLAKTGRWLGGNTPLGFESTQEEKITVDGKVRTACKLSPIKTEIETVKLLFTKFIELESVTGLETFLLKHNIKTRNGNDFTIVSLKAILSNPAYCIADKEILDYFVQNESIIGSEEDKFDGKHGLSAYNRTTSEGAYQAKRPMNEWIIAVGRHQGIIPSSEWLRVQKILYRNRMYKFNYKPQNQTALLSGVLYCKDCGSPMRPRVNSNKNGRVYPDGSKAFYYSCEMKRKSHKSKCKTINIQGIPLDQKVCDMLLGFDENGNEINNKVTELKKHISSGETSLQKQIALTKTLISDAEKEIEKLIVVLGENDRNSTVYAYTSKRVDVLDRQIHNHKKDLFRFEEEENQTLGYDAQVEAVISALATFKGTYSLASNSDKRSLIHSIIERIEWDGEKIDIFMHGEG